MRSRASIFIGYVDAALPMMARAGIDEQDVDGGCIELDSSAIDPIVAPRSGN
jgi:hypothetical protein